MRAGGKTDDPSQASAGLSRLPESEKKHGRKAAAAAPRSRKRKAEPAGPGGLGYVMTLDEQEKAGIDWHGAEPEVKAPPRRK